MKQLVRYFGSSVGKKQLASASGILIILAFLLPHLFGNLMLLNGPRAFNNYVSTLHSLGHILTIIELLFLSLFVVHVALTITVVIGNKMAQGNAYAMSRSSAERSFATRAMPFTGAIILIFLIQHLLDFKYSPLLESPIIVNGMDLGVYGLVLQTFQNRWMLLGYFTVMLVLGLHLSHSIQSFFQTFGMREGKYLSLINGLSNLAALVIAGGFTAVLIYCVIINGGV